MALWHLWSLRRTCLDDDTGLQWTCHFWRWNSLVSIICPIIFSSSPGWCVEKNWFLSCILYQILEDVQNTCTLVLIMKQKTEEWDDICWAIQNYNFRLFIQYFKVNSDLISLNQICIELTTQFIINLLTGSNYQFLN